jgi:hypothetical protein
MANEAGKPITGMLMMDRSVAQVSYGHINTIQKDVLRPKRPLSRSPIVNKVKPRKNWLPVPTVGTKGLPTALSQTWCSDDSISFELGGNYCVEKLESVLASRYRIVRVEVDANLASLAFSLTRI